MKTVQEKTSVPNMKNKLLFRGAVQLAAGISLALALTSPAFAQYGGGMGSGPGSTGTGSTGAGSTGYGSPSYGSGKAIGIGVGAAAGGAAVLYLALHHAGTVTGCVQSGDDGLMIVDDKNKSYRLMPGGADLVPGERVELHGKKSQPGSTGASFQPKKLVKNLGSCGKPAASVTGSSPSPSAMPAHDFPQR
jgi:hypothetical protein